MRRGGWKNWKVCFCCGFVFFFRKNHFAIPVCIHREILKHMVSVNLWCVCFMSACLCVCVFTSALVCVCTCMGVYVFVYVCLCVCSWLPSSWIGMVRTCCSSCSTWTAGTSCSWQQQQNCMTCNLWVFFLCVCMCVWGGVWERESVWVCVYTDLPTRSYLTVLVRKSVSSTAVQTYFSKFWQRVSRKYGNCDVNKCELVANKLDFWALVELSFVDICIFQAISRAAMYGRLWLVRKGFKPMNSDFAFEALRKLTIFRHGGFEFTVSDKWLHKTKEEEECKKPRKQAPITQQLLKKGYVGISKSCTLGGLFWRECSAIFGKNDLSRCNKIMPFKCPSVPVLQCVCMIEKCEFMLSCDTFLFWLIGGASTKNPVKNLEIQTWAVRSTDRSILG